VWNEAGYGSTGEKQHASWSLRTDGDTIEEFAKNWTRF
jgi:hypothetical protein